MHFYWSIKIWTLSLRWWTQKNKEYIKTDNQMTGLREARKSRMDEQFEAQHLDQSKRVRWHKDLSCSNELLVSSNKQWFHSFHKIHIKQPGTIFQISKPCFPCQFPQQNNKITIKSSMTQWILNTTHSLTKYRQHHNEVRDDPLIP